MEAAIALTDARAGFWQRLGAALLDYLVVSVGGFFIGFFVGLVGLPAGIAFALSIIGTAVYYVLLEGGQDGQTLGKRALGIRVIGLQTGEPIGYGRAIARYLGRIVSALPLFLGYFWMLWDSQRQTWHDKFAGSVVIPLAPAAAGVPGLREAQASPLGAGSGQAAPASAPAGAQPAQQAPSASPANWYPDPYERARLRYWDGSRWTEHTAD